jgi:hypothetical protein
MGQNNFADQHWYDTVRHARGPEGLRTHEDWRPLLNSSRRRRAATRIAALPLPEPIKNELHAEYIRTVGDLLAFPHKELHKIWGLGPKTKGWAALVSVVCGTNP